MLSAGTDPADVLAVETDDNGSLLKSSYTIAGGADLIPGRGATTPLMTVSVLAGTPVMLPEVLGRAAVAGEFVDVVGVP